MNWGVLILFLLGGFWVISGILLMLQMRRGNFSMARAIHQDMDPGASSSRWWIKIAAITAVGTLWLVGAALYVGDPKMGMPWIQLALWAIVAEQLLNPVLGPRHWKAYTGVVVGVGLYALIGSLV